MDNKLMPGCIDHEDLWGGNQKILSRYMNKVIPFLRVPYSAKCLDIGERNPQMQYIENALRINVDQYATGDLNFDKIDANCKYDVIFAMGIVEHLQNPLWFLNELKYSLSKNGSIYLNIPCNPRWLWTDKHFHEINKERLEKWLLYPIGLKIVRYRKLYFVLDWRAVFIGVRPLIKVLKGEKHWKTLLRGFLYVQWGLYEIKKVYEKD